MQYACFGLFGIIALQVNGRPRCRYTGGALPSSLVGAEPLERPLEESPGTPFREGAQFSSRQTREKRTRQGWPLPGFALTRAEVTRLAAARTPFLSFPPYRRPPSYSGAALHTPVLWARGLGPTLSSRAQLWGTEPSLPSELSWSPAAVLWLLDLKTGLMLPVQ